MSTNSRLRTFGSKTAGPGQPVYVIGEIGINHNGELENAFKLIDAAAEAGCDAVKFQKRTPEICTPRDQWDIERDTPWGRMTYIDYRHRVEFGEDEYRQIDEYCQEQGIDWFASPWDTEAVAFLEKFDVPAHKVASASLTDDELLRALRATGRTVILSTGMSTPKQIRHAVEVLGSDNILLCHATSTYPAQGRGAQPARHQHPPGRVPERPDRLLRPRDGPADHPRRGRPRRHLRRAPHHPRPRHVGLRPGRLRRAAGPDPPGPRHPHHRGLPRRRRQEGLRVASSAR